ncbi:Gfo/Idh/MocA family oxidoreductase [Antarcticibacterium sp. 1MA-6-2]|uniref:Gfo/Idh/MocA family protein n=1 Tax=Antarcticibacterium sp. 1MA-6-2 TaxID=2908210 RepID=UPI001F2E80A6|nr:Gfo/Idh/MocA family oxidoreductase [Antarcticibacterium sp. 1MA-6-2]UJH92053.1 Gfo/Idh/MocA family oxidoreductase [Antarcticibacterium sp. 1MA-6-2]
MRAFNLIIFTLLISSRAFPQEPVKVAVAGLTHGHVDWIFNRENAKDILLVGIYEPNKALSKKYAERYKLNPNIFFTDLEDMLEKVKPEAVTAFGATNEHIEVVRKSAPRGIHVMVEKPLATNLKDAKDIQRLAAKHKIHVLTNYETSWYPSNREVKTMLEDGKLGEIKKVIVNDGHEGPKEIGVSDEFLEILTDPVKNGAGALMDFGCYGANLMTWLMEGEKPQSVTAVINQNKPGIYSKVDDEATIILQYPKSQCIIQASWNWPFSRKDMEVYGVTGYAVAKDATTLKYRVAANSPEETKKLNYSGEIYEDPFNFLAAIVRGNEEIEVNNLYGLPINITVVEILEAAKKSAAQGKTIYLE